MLRYIKKLFRSVISFLLWATFFIAIFTGYIWGKSIDYPIAGVLLGAIAGLLINAVFGGLIATLLSIDENLEELNEQLYKIRQKNSWVDNKPVQLNPPLSLEEKNKNFSFFFEKKKQ